MTAADNLIATVCGRFGTILADPPWPSKNAGGKMSPECGSALSIQEIAEIPVHMLAADPAHLYLCVPNQMLEEGLRVLRAWGFNYESNIVWHKTRKDGGTDRRGVGLYFRNVTQLVLFG